MKDLFDSTANKVANLTLYRQWIAYLMKRYEVISCTPAIHNEAFNLALSGQKPF